MVFEAFQPIQLKVSKIIQETRDVKTFRLERATGLARPPKAESEGCGGHLPAARLPDRQGRQVGGGTAPHGPPQKDDSGSWLPFEFYPGQFLVLSFEFFDTAKGRLRRKNRAFSISSSPTEKSHLEITVKKTGLVSTYMHESIKEGDLLSIKNRSGEFNFREGLADDLVLIAGGTGIAPLMSMIRYIPARKLPVKMTLLYSNKTPADIVFYKELQDLESRNPLLRCVFTITRPEGCSWQGPTGRISQELIEKNISNRQALFYICGPTPMIQSCVLLLKAVGVDPSRIRLEKWD